MISMIRLLVFFAFLSLLACNSNVDDPKNGGTSDDLRLPADYESRSMVWVGFADNNSGRKYENILTEILAAITTKQKAVVLSEAESFLNNTRYKMKQAKVLADKIEFMIHEPLDVFLQDQGTVLLTDGKGTAACVQFTGGDTLNISALIQEKHNIRVNQNGWNVDPGGLQVNSKGTMIQVWEYVQNHYPGMTKAEYEAKVKSLFGVKEIIWLEKGLSIDPMGFKKIQDKYYGLGNGGEVNKICRFTNDSTIVISWPTEVESKRHPVLQAEHDIMKANLEVLSNATRANGRPYSIVKVPLPDLQYQERIVDENLLDFASNYNQELVVGDTVLWVANSSYLTYILSNEAMAVPKYWRKGLPFTVQLKDGESEGFFQRLFPDVMINPIHPLKLNYEGKAPYDFIITIPEVEVVSEN